MYNLFARRRGFDVVGVLLFGGRIVSGAEERPHDAAEVARYAALAHQLLDVGVALLEAAVPIGDEPAPQAPEVLLVVVVGARLLARARTCSTNKQS